MTTPNIEYLMERMRSFESVHTPHGWPAIQMRDISALLDALQSRAERIESQDAIDTSMAARITELEEELRNEKFEHSARRAQLAALQVDDELPEFPELDAPLRPLTGYLQHLIKGYAQDYARQAQAMVRAKMVPLTMLQIEYIRVQVGYAAGLPKFISIVRAIERAHGITGEPK